MGYPPFVQVDISLLAYQIRVSASDTLYFGEGVHDLLLAIDIGVEETKNELEVRLLAGDERCGTDVSGCLHCPPHSLYGSAAAV